MLSDLFDEYSLKARVRPAFYCLLPLVVTVYLVAPTFYSTATALFSIAVACGFVTMLANFTRYRGRKTEKRLFDAWGGKPTTILLRHTDNSLDPHTKARYHSHISQNASGWTPPTIQDELNDPAQADKVYDSAIKWLLEQTRDKKKYRLLFDENITYGYRRNTLGIKWLGITLAVLSIAIISSTLEYNTSPAYINQHIAELGIGAFCVLVLFTWLFVVNEQWVRDAADGYAMRLLASCDS